jgi:predicted nucleic acid-binding protein
MIYLDSSVIFSVQVSDANTVSAVSLVRSVEEVLLITTLCEIEVINALHLRVFRKEISSQQALQSIGDIERNVQSGIYKSMQLPESAFMRAKILAQSLTPAIGVRATDLLHVAAAIELGAKSLYTFDRKQHSAAQGAGLDVNRLN